MAISRAGSPAPRYAPGYGRRTCRTPRPRCCYGTGAAESAYVFEARYDPQLCGPIVHQATEVEDGWWMSLTDLLARLDDPTFPFVPDGRDVLRQLYGPDRSPR